MSLLQYNKAYKPFYYPWAMSIAEEHEQMHWIEGEADLAEDVKDWKHKLTEPKKNIVHQILRLFTQSDVAVGQNYADYYVPTFKNNEVRCMLLSFAAREGIHQRAYALLNDTINLPESDYRAFLNYSEMVDKMEHMADIDVDSDRGIAIALAKTVFAEGVSLFGAFSILLNFTRFGELKGMGEITRWSILDESIHVEGMSRLFRVFCDEHPDIVDDELKKAIYDQARRTVECEDKFLDIVYEMGDVDGMGKEDVKQYIRYLTDRRLIQLGLKGNYGITKNPIPWFDEIMGAPTLTNRFEARATDYTKTSMVGEWVYD